MLNFVPEKLTNNFQKDVAKISLPQNHSRPKIVKNLKKIPKVVHKNGKNKTLDEVKPKRKIQQTEKMSKEFVDKEDEDVLQGVVVIKIVGKLS